LLLAMNCFPKLKGQSHNPTMACNVCHQTEIRTVPLWQQQMPNLHLILTWIKEKEKKIKLQYHALLLPPLRY
jgi:hypothetical protein